MHSGARRSKHLAGRLRLERLRRLPGRKASASNRGFDSLVMRLPVGLVREDICAATVGSALHLSATVPRMNPRLDKFDLAILRELQMDGRLSTE